MNITSDQPRDANARVLATSSLPLAALLIIGLLLPGTPRAQAAPGPFTFSVNTNADLPDQTPGDGACDIGVNSLCTLRAAIQESNGTNGGGPNLISLQANTTYTLVRAGNDSSALNGDLDINYPVTITGAGPDSTIINANGGMTGDRAFEVNANVVISGVAIINGTSTTSGGAIRAVNANTLWLINSIVRDNSAGVSGGGIYNGATITLTHSMVLSNTSSGDGGGIYGDFGAATIVDSTIGWNVAGGSGGGLYQRNGSATLARSLLRNNRAQFGGGILRNTGSSSGFDLNNSTLSLNTAFNSGGGIYVAAGGMNVANVTVAENLANFTGAAGGTGGGVGVSPTATLTVKNSIFAANSRKSGSFIFLDDCGGAITAVAYNIFGTVNGAHCTISGPYTLTNPILLPLADNGGPTQSYPLTAGSPAIDAGSDCFDLSAHLFATDQRGKPRPALGGHGRCDLGAYEFNYVGLLPVIRR